MRDFWKSRQIDPRIRRELLSQKVPILIGLICTVITSTLYSSTIYLSQLAVHYIQTLSGKVRADDSIGQLEKTQALGMLAWVCACVVLVFLLRYTFTRAQVFYLSKAANQLTANLRQRLLSKLLRLPVSYYGSKRTGAIQSVLTNDVNVFQMAIGIVRDSIEAPIKAVAALVTIFIIQPKLALITLLMVPVFSVVISRNAKKMRIAQAEVQTDLAEIAAVTQEVLQGVRVVKAFGAEDRTDAEYKSINDRGLNSQMTAAKLVASLRPMVELIGASALAVVFYLSGRLAMAGELQVSHVVALAFAMDTVNQGFKGYSGISNIYSQVQAAADRIYGEILDVEEQHERSTGATLSNPAGRIAFEGVSFNYPDGTAALRNVNFVIEPGTSLALVGASGAGKTTIADLLLRFYDPTEGRITYDGVDIRELSVPWLRSTIGVVPQHTFLFAGSIEDNVKMGRPDANPAEIISALEKANALEFSTAMAERENSILGERGMKLSGGQMQRVAIARAIVRDPVILLLDEATSALDAASEKAVTEALGEVMKDRTTLFIAHRLTTAARADNIAVLKRGEVMEIGSHKVLMEKNGEYAALFRVFSSGVLEGPALEPQVDSGKLTS